MANQNTGFARMKKLTVTKGEYSQDYYITAAFHNPHDDTDIPAITDEAFALLDDADYNARLDAFIHYVCYTEEGLGDECPGIANGAVVWDPVTCPVTVTRNNEPLAV